MTITLDEARDLFETINSLRGGLDDLELQVKLLHAGEKNISLKDASEVTHLQVRTDHRSRRSSFREREAGNTQRQ